MTPKPLLLPPEEILQAIAWHIRCTHEAYADIPLKQYYTAEGVWLVPIDNEPKPEKVNKLVPANAETRPR